MQMFSEHHTGRAIDIATPGTRPLTAEFESSAAFVWLEAHAATFGFRMPYVVVADDPRHLQQQWSGVVV